MAVEDILSVVTRTEERRGEVLAKADCYTRSAEAILVLIQIIRDRVVVDVKCTNTQQPIRSIATLAYRTGQSFSFPVSPRLKVPLRISPPPDIHNDIS